MGIRGLQSYLETNCPESCQTVRIADLAEDFRRQNPNCPSPVIVVDGMGCLQKMYGDRLWVMGGQWSEYMEQWSLLVNRLNQIGVKVVFFFDGTTVATKRERWVERRLRGVSEVRRIIHTLQCTGKEPPLDMFQLPVGMGLMTRYALKYVLGCEVWTTIRECDEVVAEYAKNCPDCFAILGQDSDYIVYYVTASYLSVANLNVDTLTTVMYDRRGIADHFGLSLSQMPILACLRGNDIISDEVLRPFHELLCNGRRDEVRHSPKLLHRIANFLRYLNIQIEDCISDSAVRQLEELAKLVFDDLQQVNLLIRALETYGMGRIRENQRQAHSIASRHGQAVLKIAKENHESCEAVPTIYSLMCGAEYESSTPMEDDRDLSLPPSALLYRPVRQRTYTLLVTPIGRNYVDEWCVYGGRNQLKSERVTTLPIILPSGGSTSLQELWLGGSTKLKYETYLACFESSFNMHELLTIPVQYHSPCSIINYLIRNTNITEWEVDALIVHMFHPIGTDITRLKALEVPTLAVRCVHLGTLFLRGVTTVLHVLGVTGFPFRQELAMPWLFYDGKLLAHCYNAVKEGVKIEQLLEFQKLAFQHFLLVQQMAKLGTQFEWQLMQN